jgi:hypothetical protein
VYIVRKFEKEKEDKTMKEPKEYKGKETLVYFTITLWPIGGGYGNTLKTVYKTVKGAERKAIAEMKSGLWKEATIRENSVFYRDENNEFSSSGVYKNIQAAF